MSASITRWILQYAFWLVILVETLKALSDSVNELQIFRYAGF